MKKKRGSYYNQKGFLENLKDLGGGIARSAVEDVVKGTAEELTGQLTGLEVKKTIKEGVLEQGKPLDLAAQEKEIREEERRAFERQKAHEKTVWLEEQQKITFQVRALQEELKEELKNLVSETDQFNREIRTAAFQTIVEPGSYHLSFFGRLRKLIKLIRKKIQESKTWLIEWNSYCKRKRNFYWAQVKKSGTKYMLSSERYMSTQAG